MQARIARGWLSQLLCLRVTVCQRVASSWHALRLRSGLCQEVVSCWNANRKGWISRCPCGSRRDSGDNEYEVDGCAGASGFSSFSAVFWRQMFRAALRRVPSTFQDVSRRVSQLNFRRSNCCLVPCLPFGAPLNLGLDGPDKRRRETAVSQKQSLLIASPSG